MAEPADRSARRRALDPGASFIVQAPAGSGKTELLTQRFLRLLARVERPEQVLAITFTRKATREMRERIVKRLAQAESGEVPNEDHERLAVEFARDVLARDAEQGWKLLRNPGRLRIQTIDGLCAHIAARDPVLGRGAGSLRIEEDARPLYQAAAEALIEEAGAGEAGAQLQSALARLLAYLDGNASRLQRLVASMLDLRDQWLDRMGADLASMRGALHQRQRLELRRLEAALGRDALDDAVRLACDLGARVAEPSATVHRLRTVCEQSDAGTGDESRVALVHAVLDVLTTSARDLVRARPATQFPGVVGAGDALAALQKLATGWRDSTEATEAISRFVKAPPVWLDGAEADILDDLRELLRAAVAWLIVEMEQRGHADFTHVAECAVAVLGDSDAPNPVLLQEDYRLQHILMDEFQDTSHTQHQLLERLVAGWMPGDGRTLFLVGDPMQSIYRFRKADVQLFTEAFERGQIGPVTLEPLRLASNFRSRPGVIEWVNEHVGGLFPAPGARRLGAVSYAPVEASRSGEGRVELRALPPGADEAAVVADWIASLPPRTGDADTTVGVLARKKLQLAPIADELARRGVRFEAVDSAPLETSPAVMDMLALTRALWHRGDRVAWLALLRAPWCALTPAELLLVAGDLADADVLERCGDARVQAAMEPDRAERVAVFCAVMREAMAARGSVPLADAVEAAWVRLGGPCAGLSTAETENVRSYLDCLRAVMRRHPADPIEEVQRAITDLGTRARPARIRLMTIHKAKGLEFDHVAMPALDEVRGGGSGDQPMLRLQEFRTERGVAATLVAPMTRTGDDSPSLYRYLKRLDTDQEGFEDRRVLYVGVTRARDSALLTGRYKLDANGSAGAPKGSWMGALWPLFEAAISDTPEAVAEHAPLALPLLSLHGLPEPGLVAENPAQRASGDRQPLAMDALPSRSSTALGSALHQWLELAHDDAGMRVDADWLAGHSDALRSSLLRGGAYPDELNEMVPRLEAMLLAAADDERVSAKPAGTSFAELALDVRDGQRLRRLVLDHAGCDHAGRWLITDFKTGAGDAGQRERWARQLAGYAGALERAVNAEEVRTRVVHFHDTGISVRSGEGEQHG